MLSGGVCYSCLGQREGAYHPCPRWARIYRLMMLWPLIPLHCSPCPCAQAKNAAFEGDTWFQDLPPTVFDL